MVPDDSLTIRERAIAAWPTGWHGQNLRDILTTLGYDVDRPWRDFRRRIATGSCSPTSSRRCRSMPATMPDEVQARAQAKEEPSYHGHLHRRQALCPADLRHHPKRADEETGRAVHGERGMSAVPRQAAAPRSAVGEIRRPRYRRDVAAAAEAAGATAGPCGRSAEPDAKQTRRIRKRRVVAAYRRRTWRPGSRCCSISASAI